MTVDNRIHIVSLMSMWLLIGGCGDLKPVTPFEPIRDGSELFGALTLNHRAVTLSMTSPYDTIRLVATPRNLRDEPLEGLPEATFRSVDTMYVQVSPDGLVQARMPTSGVPVIAELVTGDNIRHVDTAIVRVNAAVVPGSVASLKIESATPELSQLPMTTNADVIIELLYASFLGRPGLMSRTIRAIARDSAGNVVPDLEIEYVSLDPDNVKVDRRTGAVSRVNGPPGRVSIVVRTNAYGSILADTASFVVTGPMTNGFGIVYDEHGTPRIQYDEIIIRPGGYVLWTHTAPDSDPISVTFNDYDNDIVAVEELCSALGAFMEHFCESGNIAPYAATTDNLLQAIRIRQFPNAGTYSFTIPELTVHGRVRVVDDNDDLWDVMRNRR